MNYIICTAALALILTSHTSEAGVKALSRANCVGWINESVTWDRPEFRKFLGATAATHRRWGEAQDIHPLIEASNNYETDWRFYAGDWGDSGNVTVVGTHFWYVLDDSGYPIDPLYSASTRASNCNLGEW